MTLQIRHEISPETEKVAPVCLPSQLSRKKRRTTKDNNSFTARLQLAKFITFKSLGLVGIFPSQVTNRHIVGAATIGVCWQGNVYHDDGDDNDDDGYVG